MFVIFLIAIALWVGGAFAGFSTHKRLLGLLALWILVMAAQLFLSPHHPLHMSIGGTAYSWLVIGIASLVVYAYVAMLKALRKRAHHRPPLAAASPQPSPSISPSAPPSLSEEELSRYSRHILLRDIGGMGQRQLKNSRVLVVGAGGLGAPALLYLAASGVGHIGIIDDDVVELSNLQRQIIHTQARIGMPKVLSAQQALSALNPHVEISTYQERLDESNAEKLIANYDLILDGSDNLDTRYALNRACFTLGKPFIFAALSQWEGQLCLFRPGVNDGPCYECVFPRTSQNRAMPNCASAGVAAPLPGILGTMMAGEAIKYLLGIGTSLEGHLLIYDLLYGQSRNVSLHDVQKCHICGLRNNIFVI